MDWNLSFCFVPWRVLRAIEISEIPLNLDWRKLMWHLILLSLPVWHLFMLRLLTTLSLNSAVKDTPKKGCCSLVVFLVPVRCPLLGDTTRKNLCLLTIVRLFCTSRNVAQSSTAQKWCFDGTRLEYSSSWKPGHTARRKKIIYACDMKNLNCVCWHWGNLGTPSQVFLRLSDRPIWRFLAERCFWLVSCEQKVTFLAFCNEHSKMEVHKVIGNDLAVD